MQQKIWLRITARKSYSTYVAGEIKVSKSKPDTSANQVAIQLDLDIPDAIFEKPQFVATIKVPKESVSMPIVNADIETNIAHILKQQLGIEVHVTATEEKTDV